MVSLVINLFFFRSKFIRDFWLVKEFLKGILKGFFNGVFEGIFVDFFLFRILGFLM